MPKHHDFALTEIDPPGVWEVRCSCGFLACAFWGLEHAREILRRHLEDEGALGRIIPLR